MKKTILLILITIVIIITIVPMTFAIYDNSKTIKNDERIEANNQSQSIYYELTENEVLTNKKINLQKIKYNNYILNSMDLLENINMLNNMQVKYYENKVDNRVESVFYNEEMKIKFNAQTGNFISFSKKLKDDYPDSKITEEQVKEKATKLFSKLNYENYKFVDAYPFDDDIWLVQFAKIEENGLINIGSSIKFSFVVSTDEILTFNVIDYPYENNETLVTKNQLEEIASEYNKFNLSYDISLEIACPNDFWTSNSNADCLSENYYMNVFVITYNDEQKTKVFVDSTTGSVIGGDMKLGGTKYE